MFGITALFVFTLCGAMIIAFRPTLRIYALSPIWGLALLVIALTNMVWTIESALQCAHGSAWKGRVQAAPRGAR